MLRIIAIEDDANMREMMRIHLSGIGLAVELFADASTGIRSILSMKPDLVLLDLILPDLDGLEILRALKDDESTRNIPVVVVTSKTDDSHYNQAKLLGVNAFLTKPLQREALVKTVLGEIAKHQAALSAARSKTDQ